MLDRSNRLSAYTSTSFGFRGKQMDGRRAHIMNEAVEPFTELHVQVLATGRHFRLTEDFTYFPPGGEAIVAPANFRTDFASIPRFATLVVRKLGRHTQPAVIHDYLCREANTWQENSEGDTVFREAMKAVGVVFLKRWAMYVVVWVAGVIAWAIWTFKINGRVGKQAEEDKIEAEKKAA